MPNCPKCHKKFRDRGLVRRHLAAKKPCDAQTQTKYICQVCDKEFKSNWHLVRHSHVHAGTANRQPITTLVALTEPVNARDVENSNTESCDHTVNIQDEQVETEDEQGEDPLSQQPVVLQPDETDSHESHESRIRVKELANCFKFGKKKIRKTNETPQRVSVYDLIAAITDQDANNVRQIYTRVDSVHPEVVAKCHDFKFAGQGQRTPVTDARGAVIIMNLLPGHKEAKSRLADLLQQSEVTPAEANVSSNESHMTVVDQVGFFEFGDKKIRKTNETPQRVSVYDLIRAMTDQEAKNAITTFLRLKDTSPEVTALSSNFKFAGQGQRITPVTNARGAVIIMNLLQGHKAAQFRMACADVVVRYLGGDETLIAEIKRNQVMQDAANDTDAMSLFADAVTPLVEFHESKAIELQSATNVINLRAPQHYMRQVFGKWSNVHPVGRPHDIVSPEELAQCAVVKTGSQGENTGRQLTHNSAFSRSKLLDSTLTNAYAHIEMKTKDYWVNNGELYEGLHEGKTVRDTELLLVKDQDDYERQLAKVQQFCCAEDTPLELRLAQEKSKQMDADARKSEAEAGARKTEAEASVKQKQLELEIIKLQFEMRKFEQTSS